MQDVQNGKSKYTSQGSCGKKNLRILMDYNLKINKCDVATQKAKCNLGQISISQKGMIQFSFCLVRLYLK